MFLYLIQPTAAYFTQATVDQLDTINEIHGVGNLFVPEGLFQSTRTGKNRKSDGEESRARPKDVFQPSITNNRKYAPFPTAYSGPSTPRPDVPQTSAVPERHHQNDIAQGTSYYHPETQALMPHFSPATGTHYNNNLPPLHSPPHSDYDSERRLSLPNIHADQNSAHGRYADTPYHSGSTVAASQSHVYNETSTYSSSPPLHHHAHLRERFVSYPRETQAPSSVEAQPHYGEWQRPSPNGSSSSAPYTLRPTYASTSTTHNYAHSSHSSDCTGNGGYSRSHSPSSEHTSPTTSHSHRSPSSHEYSLADERHVPYETTSSVRTRFPHDGETGNGEGPGRVKLAPLHSLRNHPYRRDPVDDKALRKLRPRAP
jgi:Gti1/Pac2 family transcription factor